MRTPEHEVSKALSTPPQPPHGEPLLPHGEPLLPTGEPPLPSCEPLLTGSADPSDTTTTCSGDARKAVEDSEAVENSYVWLMVLAVFGVFMAIVTPMAISLAIRVDQLAPGHEEYLGYITGAGGITAILTAPVFGMVSDRTRSRLGRRRPLLIAGTVVGLVALPVMALADGVLVLALALGWMLAQVGWGTVLALLTASQANRLPEAQRGKVAALTGVVQQLAPVSGALLAGALSGSSLLMFLVPGAVGAVSMFFFVRFVCFVCFVHEPDSRDLPLPEERLTLRTLTASYVFDPRRSPDFAWNWLGKFLFMFGLTLTSTFTAFFLAARTGVSVKRSRAPSPSWAGPGSAPPCSARSAAASCRTGCAVAVSSS
ncbi:MFS transporter [Streptomyces brasiliscabiei]|uniref:MFS transporter n=1 Tax=Streptomyces brasiliscabiei TaxID=2736302 RepID=A0ABU8G7H0_9ACTN